MKRSTKLAFAAVATLGLAAAAVPVIAQQTQMPYGRMMGGGMGMMAGHDGFMGGMMGGMMGVGLTSTMAAHDTNGDGILSDEERTAGIAAEITSYDANADGTLSLDEFATMYAAHTRLMMVRVFQMHDADGDAQVTDAEMMALADMMQGYGQGFAGGYAHRHAAQGDMPRPGRGLMGDN